MSNTAQPKILKRMYFGYTSHSARLIPNGNPFEEQVAKPDIARGTCSRKGCNNTETIDNKGIIKRFQRCTKCLSIYCSNTCLISDHKEGEHKDKCRKFTTVKETMEKTMCKQCWDIKWKEISNPDSLSHSAHQCKMCRSKRLVAEIQLPQDIIDDTDIQRIWF